MSLGGNQCVRLIGGQWRRRVLHFPAATGLRPTADAVRERLFNWLGQDLTGWRCLDLFAGSGALGFEAASRGAASVWMVEQDKAVCDALAASKHALHAEQVTLIRADAGDWIRQQRAALLAQPFDLVMLDPPFVLGKQAEILSQLQGCVHKSGWVYVEHNGALQPSPVWEIWRQGKTGQAYYCLLRQVNYE